MLSSNLQVLSSYKQHNFLRVVKREGGGVKAALIAIFKNAVFRVKWMEQGERRRKNESPLSNIK